MKTLQQQRRRRQFKWTFLGWRIGSRHGFLPGVNLLVGSVFALVGFMGDVILRGCFEIIPSDLLHKEQRKKYPARIAVLKQRHAEATCPRRKARLQRDIERLEKALAYANNIPDRWDR